MNSAKADLELFERLRALTQKPGPIGRETEFNTWLKDRWAGIRKIDSIISAPGNLLVRVGGRGPKVLLVAHADEVSFTIRTILDQGLCRIRPAMPDREGRPERRMGYHIAGQPALLIVDGDPVEGVFTTVTGHVTTHEQRIPQEIRWRDFLIDTGCSSHRECEDLGIHPGTPVIWNPSTRRIGKRIVGKAMDDRAGLAILETLLAEVEPEKLDCELWLAATAMEECRAIGAKALASQHYFDLVIVVDVGLSSDCPDVSEDDVPVRMGDGGVLVVQDNAAHYDLGIIDALEACAQDNHIKVQRAVYGVDGSYASDGLRFIECGMKTALIAFPNPYTHCPFEMVDEQDLLAIAHLLKMFVEQRGRYDA